jgi:competence protein ComEA
MRLRIGLGAGVVLVLLLAAIAVVVGAASHGTTAVAAQPRAVHTVRPDSGADPGAADAPAPVSSHSPMAFVHVVGQVTSPGLYELPAGSRIVDAVAAAGGFSDAADQAALNLAQVVQDGQQVVVPAQGTTGASSDPAGSGSARGGSGSDGSVGSGGTVDLNSADAAALQTLDGIGPALAERILAYRAAHGGFRSVNDLQNVTGIGPKKFAAIKGSVST